MWRNVGSRGSPVTGTAPLRRTRRNDDGDTGSRRRQLARRCGRDGRARSSLSVSVRGPHSRRASGAVGRRPQTCNWRRVVRHHVIAAGRGDAWIARRRGASADQCRRAARVARRIDWRHRLLRGSRSSPVSHASASRRHASPARGAHLVPTRRRASHWNRYRGGTAGRDRPIHRRRSRTLCFGACCPESGANCAR